MDDKKLFYRLLLLFPITTLIQSGLLFWINQVLFAIVLLLMLRILFVDKRISKHEVILYLIMICNHIYAIWVTTWPLYHINSLFYMLFFVLYSIFIRNGYTDLKQYFLEDHRYILNIIRLWNIVVGVSIFLPSSYQRSWGGASYFNSITSSTFRLSPTAFMIMTLVIAIYIIHQDKKLLFYVIVPLYCFYMGGSRTFLAVGVLTFLIFWYVYLPKPKHFYISLLPVLTLAFFAIQYTAAGDKIAATTYQSSSYFDYWGTVTNGRSIFWQTDLISFSRESFLNRLLGCGFNYVYDVNLKFYKSPIWAHNDLINILLNFGYVGVMIYSYAMSKVFSVAKAMNTKLPIVLIGMIILIWFITAMFNMYYTYFCSLIAFPLLVVLVSSKYNVHSQMNKARVKAE